MSFLGVKVILFLVIPLIIKEKSNASALASTVVNACVDRCTLSHRPLRDDFNITVKHTLNLSHCEVKQVKKQSEHTY